MPHPSRRALRAEHATKPRRPLWKSFRLWVPVGLLVVIGAVGITGWVFADKLADRAYAARDALEAAMPLAGEVKAQILAGDTAAAQQTATELAARTAEARRLADGDLWRFGEGVPAIGGNLTAVRQVAVIIDDLVTAAVIPASQLSLDRFAPVDGRIDLAALSEASTIVDDTAAAVARARAGIDAIDRSGLIDQVSAGVDQLDEAVAGIEPVIVPAQTALTVLPDMLGASGARNYLVMVQNNAESRGTGGNPAALVLLTVDGGAISITQQASSTDFDNGRATPVTDLDPATVALYGDKVGRYMQDVTTTPDFTESARIMAAFWAESFGTPVDAFVSIDPVALSYLLQATGPVTLPNGDVLTGDNAVSTLLSDVYFRFDSDSGAVAGEQTDAYFAMAAEGVFGALTSARDPLALIEQAGRAVEEGRLLYVSTVPAEQQILDGTRIAGRLPADNADITMVGSYVNDITAAKLDYYLDTAVSVASDVCQINAGVAPAFRVSTTLTSRLRPDEVAGLPHYVSPGQYFPKGQISTDLVVYGPVGASFVAASVDGQPVSAIPAEHLGRPAVKINVLSDPATTHEVSVDFAGTAGDSYGPLEVWHTPMVRESPVTIDTPGCAAGE